jgi:hypothetical protein
VADHPAEHARDVELGPPVHERPAVVLLEIEGRPDVRPAAVRSQPGVLGGPALD